MQPYGSTTNGATSMRVLRGAILAIGLVLGTVLLVRGSVLIGGLIVASVVLRTLMFINMTRARSSGAPGRGGRRGRAGGSGPAFQRLTPGGIDAAARALTMSAADLRTQLTAGRSIADIATGRGVGSEQVVQAVTADASARLDQVVLAGRLASRRADRARSFVPIWANRLVHGGPARSAVS